MMLLSSMMQGIREMSRTKIVSKKMSRRFKLSRKKCLEICIRVPFHMPFHMPFHVPFRLLPSPHAFSQNVWLGLPLVSFLDQRLWALVPCRFQQFYNFICNCVCYTINIRFNTSPIHILQSVAA